MRAIYLDNGQAYAYFVIATSLAKEEWKLKYVYGWKAVHHSEASPAGPHKIQSTTEDTHKILHLQMGKDIREEPNLSTFRQNLAK